MPEPAHVMTEDADMAAALKESRLQQCGNPPAIRRAGKT